MSVYPLDQKQEFDRQCEGCAFGKQHRNPFPKKSEHESSQLLELIHTDVCGPISIDSVGGSRYFVTFIDDYSKYTTVYIIKHKSEVLKKFKEYVYIAENFTGLRVKRVRSGNAQGHVSESFKNYCKSRGIMRDDTVPYTPQQNGVAERMNRTIMETVRCMIHNAELPLRFWAEAVAAAVYLCNRSPTASVKDSTPYELWHKEKPDESHLKVFGCNAFVHIPDQKRKKFDKKSIHCIFVGYPAGCKGYKLYNPATKKMLRSKDVIFMEKSFGHKLLDGQKNADLLIEHFKPEFKYEESEDSVTINNQQDVPEVPPGKPQRNRGAPDRLGVITGEWWNYVDCASTAIFEEPKNIKEAYGGHDSSQWKNATDSEYESLMKNCTWDLVELPEGKNVVGCK